jgi:DNA replication and repair protein RecF
VFVEKLKLFQFRNIRSGEYLFPEQISFIVGDNGQGKSNLIEAISFLSCGRSFRTSSARDMATWGTDSYSVFAAVRGTPGSFEIGMSLENGRRKAFINGNKVPSMSKYVGELTSVTFAPSDLALIQGGPSFRRNFVDKHLVDVNPRIFNSLATYHRALQHRNALLKQGERTRALYHPYEEILAQETRAIGNAKKNFIEALNKKSNAYYQELSQGKDGELALTLLTNIPETDTIEDIQKRFDIGFDKDFYSQSTTLGHHRDDVQVMLDNREARAFASQGQTRSIVLSLKLAALDLIEETRGDSPVLLLDDIESELDRGRMEKLLSLLFRRDRQVILTGTELATRELFEDHGYHVFSIRDGQVNILK